MYPEEINRGGVIVLATLVHLIINVQCSKKSSVSLIVGGDISFGGIVKYLARNGRCKSYDETLAPLGPYFRSADISLVNLECTVQDKNMELLDDQVVHMVAETRSLRALKNAGINYVALGNNHILDLKAGGVNTTTRVLRNNGIGYVGLSYGDMYARQTPLIVERHGVKIGFLSYCHEYCISLRKGFNVGMALYKTSIAVLDVQDLRKEGCHVVVIYMHWDNEYTSLLMTSNANKIRSLLKQAPVEVIIGGHPHTVHPHFYSNRTLVASSLGNLLFPSHYAVARHLNNADFSMEMKNTTAYEKVWVKQSLLMKNPSSYGRLLKVELDKNGVVPEKSMYLDTQMFPSRKTNCLIARRKRKAKWVNICGPNDDQCMGTSTCNAVECDGFGL